MKQTFYGMQARKAGLLLKLLFFLAVLAALVALAWMLFLPAVLTQQMAARTGFPTEVEQVYVNPFSGVARITGLEVENPDDFPANDFLTLQHFATDVELLSLMSERIILDRLVLNVSEVSIVRNEEGHTNVDLFRTRVTPPADPREPATEAKPFLIKEFLFRLDRVVIADHSGPTPTVRTFETGINRTFQDVTDFREIIMPLVADLSAAGLGDLAGSILGVAIPAPVRDILDQVLSGSGILQDGRNGGTDPVKNIFDALEESLKR